MELHRLLFAIRISHDHIRRRARISGAAFDPQPPVSNTSGQGVFLEFRFLHQPMRDPAQQFGLWSAAIMTTRP